MKQILRKIRPSGLFASFLVFGCGPLVAAEKGNAKPIEIAAVKREAPVDFAKDIQPLLSKKCLACHNETKSENGLVLESPQTILKGGDSGPALLPGKGAESLILKAAAHDGDPVMPPPDNKVGAAPFTPEELGLLKLWIDQGAKGEAAPHAAAPLRWQPLPPGMNPIYSVTVSADGQYAACSRANQVFVYHLPSGRLITRLTDPALLASGMYKNPGVAHRDLVQMLLFSPGGDLLASSAYREVKLWRRPQNVRSAVLGASEAILSCSTSPDGRWAAAGLANGNIKIWELPSGKESKTLSGLAGAVGAVRFFPSNDKLVSGSADKLLCVWNLADGALLCRTETPVPITAAALVGDATQVATGGGDDSIRLWKLPALTPGETSPPAATAIAELKGHSQPVTALEVLPTDKSQLFSGSSDGTIRKWNTQNGQQAQQMDHGSQVLAIAVRSDGKQVASGGGNNLIKLWNADNGQPWSAPGNQPIGEMKGDFRAQVRTAALERAVVLAKAKVESQKNDIADAETRAKAAEEAIKTTATAKEAAAKTLTEKSAAAKSAAEAKATAEKELADAQAAQKAAMDKAAETKAAADKDAQNADLKKAAEEAQKVVEETGKKVKDLEKKVDEASKADKKASRESTAAEAASTAADQAAASAVTNLEKAKAAVPLVQETLKKGEQALALQQAEVEISKIAAVEKEKPVRALAYAPDNQQLASGCNNQLVRTWSAESGAPLETFDGHHSPVLAVSFTADGRLLSAGPDKSAILWDVNSSWALERTIGDVETAAAFIDRVNSLAFSPDGKLLATGGGEPSRSGELKIWNVADGSLARAISDAHSDTIFGLSFSPDGAYIASAAADRFVKVFEVASGKLARSFEGHTHHVLGVAWRADGKMLASGGADNVVKVWDFTTGDQKLTTQPLGKEVTSINFVSDTARALVGSGDKTVRLYNTENGANERNFAGAGDFVYSTALTADGKIAIAGGQDSTLWEWNVENAQLIKSFEAPKTDGDTAMK